MSVQTEEARMILAIEAIRTSKKLSGRKAITIYEVPESILCLRINGSIPLPEYRPANTVAGSTTIKWREYKSDDFLNKELRARCERKLAFI